MNTQVQKVKGTFPNGIKFTMPLETAKKVKHLQSLFKAEGERKKKLELMGIKFFQ